MDPVTIFFGVSLLVASYAITALTARRPPNAKPAAVTDFEIAQAEEGTPQAIIFGDCWTDDYMVLWYGNYRVRPIYAKSKKK